MLQKDDIERIVENYIRDNLKVALNIKSDYGGNKIRIEIKLGDSVISDDWVPIPE